MRTKHRQALRSAKPRGSRTHAAEATPSNLIPHVAKGLAIALASSVLLLLSLSLVAYFTPDPNQWIQPFGIATAAATALIGGFASARLHGHAALLCGLSAGCLLTAIMLLLSLFFASQASAYTGLVSCLLHVGIIVLSVLGAYLALHRSTKKKHKKHFRQ